MNIRQVTEAIEAGHNTNDGIAEYLDLDYRHVSRELKRMCEDGDLTRWREGQTFVYQVTGSANTNDASDASDETAASPPTENVANVELADDDVGDLKALIAALADQNAKTTERTHDGTTVAPVDRDYDWDQLVLESVDEYLPHDGELDRIQALITSRETTGQLPHFLIGGPTGCGKTTLAEYIAYANGWPIITIQGRYSMYDVDLLGQSIVAGDTTVWIDGPLTKALLASRDGPVVLLIDEANRARPEAMSAVFSALDHRGQVTLDERGGEKIKGNPLNLVVFSTINEGREYFVEEMDLAAKRRFGTKFEVDYLGYNHPDREAELVGDRTPASYTLGKELVKAANAVRDLARDDDSPINIGVPTSTLLDWANAAYSYDQAGIDNPVYEASKDTLVKALYGRPDDRDEVLEVLRPHIDGCPFNADAVETWLAEGGANAEHAHLTCDNCGWGRDVSDAPDKARDQHICPKCGDTLRFDE